MSRPEYIQVRFTLQEKERYTALARVEGLSLAEWVRERVGSSVEREEYEKERWNRWKEEEQKMRTDYVKWLEFETKGRNENGNDREEDQL